MNLGIVTAYGNFDLLTGVSMGMSRLTYYSVHSYYSPTNMEGEHIKYTSNGPVKGPHLDLTRILIER